MSRLVVTTALLAAIFVGAAPQPASASITAVSGGAFGYQTFVGLFGGPPDRRGPVGTTNCTGGIVSACTPTVVVPAGGGGPFSSTDNNGATAQYGPAILHQSVSETASTEGVTGPAGSVTSSASVTYPSQAVQNGPVFSDAVSSTCTASESGVTGSSTLTNTSLALSTYPVGHPEEGGPRVMIPLPVNPAPNTEYEGKLDHIGNEFGREERFRLVFNEQIRTADSIVVNAFHMYILGEVAVGEYIAAQSRCGFSSGVANAAPSAGNDAYNAVDGSPLTIAAAAGLLANDSDPTGQPLTARKVTAQAVPSAPPIDCFSAGLGPCAEPVLFPADPDHGDVVVNSNGSFTYTSVPGYVGPDSFQYVVNDVRGASATGTVSITVGLASAGTFTAVPPARILDTRPAPENTGTCTPSPCAPVVAGAPIQVQVTGRGGIPASGVSAVVMSVAVTGATSAGFLRVWPSDAAEPNASNLNYVAGQTVPNLVTVKLSATGTVKMSHNTAGSTHVIVDVAGYYGDGTGAAASRFNPLTPARVLDTRPAPDNIGVCTPSPCAPVSTGSPIELQITGQGGVPPNGVTAVVMSVAVTGSTGAGFLRVWPADAAEPNASNLNYVLGQTVPNLVTVKVSPTGRVKISHNGSGSTHVIADVAGWYGVAGTTTGSRFMPVTPARILDTRSAAETGDATPIGKCATSAVMAPCSRVVAGNPVMMEVDGQAGVPAAGAKAVVMNVAVTGPTADSFLTVWPGDAAQPTASNLNFVAGQTVPNLTAIRLSNSGIVRIANFSGSTHVISDVAGWFN